MPKGMYTQGLCVLLKDAVDLDQIAAVLSEFEICKRIDENENWFFSGPSLILAYDIESNGLVAVDIVDQTWPDPMGSPEEPELFAAWSFGNFGPYTFPGGLARASQHCWAWEPGRTIAASHRAFIRVRSSYAFGAGDDEPVMPKDYEALPELHFATAVVASLLELPEALCYFNPNGEILRSHDDLTDSLEHGLRNEIPPLDVWSNIRFFNVNPQWTLMDTVGNSQFDVRDMEAIFHAESYDFNEVDHFLRNVSLYVVQNGEVIKDGDTVQGPGNLHWQATHSDSAVCEPPRRVLTFVPMDGREIPPEVDQARGGE